MARIDCVCPPKADGQPRHPNGDTITLRERLNFRDGLAARNAVIMLKQEDPDASVADILATLTEAYLLTGVESWTLADEKGKPLPVNRVNLRAFMDAHAEAAMIVGEEADALYSAVVIAPLVARASKLSPPTPTEPSTSATNGSAPQPRKRSKPSSISTIQTADTDRMSASPGGAFS
jgi:hypothetical protein